MDHRFSAFSKVTNNQAYKMAFNDLWMRRDQDNPSEFIGNTQRHDFLKGLNSLVSSLPSNPHIFDFGAGAGEIVDALLQKVPSATIHLEEPNEILMKEYLTRLQKYPHLKKGEVFYEKLQEMEVPNKLKNKIDLALGLHMIYHFDELELFKALSKMYELLKVGGKIFLVYADQEASTTGLAAQYYYKKRGMEKKGSELRSIWKARNRLLRDGGIASLMNKEFPQFKALASSENLSSYIFAEEVSEIAIMCLTGELGTIDNRPFEMEKLNLCLSFVGEQAGGIGLSLKENKVAKRDMLRANQPQVVTVIEKKSLN